MKNNSEVKAVNIEKKQKIGIMTFHASNNCGSMLQAFALQRVLIDKFGVECELIDFSNEGQRAMYRTFWKVNGIKAIIKNALWLSVYSEIKKQIDAYASFSEKYFRLSENSYSTCEQLSRENSVYDKYITGSDQVWNICCMDADDAYYLSFVTKGKKYAYAVSFGANNPYILENGEHYKKLTKEFDRISVREENARKWIKSEVGINVPLCLDPTMLLDQGEWEKYIQFDDVRIIQGNYIFYYCFSISQRIASFLHSISKQLNMPVYFLEPKEWALRCCWKNSIHLVGKYGPETFLNLMKYANIIFTTSFHGTAFSTIFHKNFWYIDSEMNDPEKDDRAISFLSQLGLMERYKTLDYLSRNDLNITPDYQEVDNRLCVLKENSMLYLKKMVEDE